jgi:ribosomal protein S18 acetylase RimI-like enzyme
MTTVRVLGVGDAIAVRDIRLEGLRLEPASFGSSWEEEADQPLTWWQERLAGPARTLGAHVDGDLAGVLVVSLKSRVKLAHNAEIGAVYVRPAFRRRGVANLLMQSAMDLLRCGEFAGRAKFATLHVTAGNDSARGLYERFGFRVCGQLERVLCFDGVFYDELLMRTGLS